MAGSKRMNIGGHTIDIHPDQARELRRLAGDAVQRLFREAQEGGQSPVTLGAFTYLIQRLPDHTFRLVRHADEHRSIF